MILGMMLKYYWTRYLPGYLKTLLYMLQSTEYKLSEYLRWLYRATDYRTVMKRRSLDMTTKVKLLLAVLRAGAAILLLAVGLCVYHFVITQHWAWIVIAVLIAVGAPKILAYGIVAPLFLGDIFIQKPRERTIIRRAKKTLRSHPAIRIAVAGSYGKTSAKELLLAVLSEGKKTAATPGNMNTDIGISRFVSKLHGDEEVLIFELGEEKRGDVTRLAKFVQPSIGVITGIAAAHLNSFKTMERVTETIFELADFVELNQLYTNQDSPLVAKNRRKSVKYSNKAAGKWKVSNVTTSVDGTRFTATNKDKTIKVHTGLVGLHTVGPTIMAIAVADGLGVSSADIQKGLKKVQPYEHRMQPRLLHGAWVIDDTYNGNSEGVKAGLAFLKDSGANRRVYVTPGLVEQGALTQKVHEEIGKQIAASADVAVLMHNSVTEFIKNGLAKGDFEGMLVEIDDPLEFYTNLEHFVAVGDVVLMQNDWTDNYR